MRIILRCLLTVYIFIVLVGVSASLSGCGDENDDGMPKTLEGAKDKIRTLEAEITRLNAGIKNLEDKTKAEKGDLRLLVSQLRQENDDLARAARLGERMAAVTENNGGIFLSISIAVNFLAFLVIVFMQLRHRRLWDECNHYITHRLHG